MYKTLCLGASIVKGMFGAGFVQILKQRMAKDGFHFINSGVGGSLAFDVLARMDREMTVMPDCALILVGTNDITAELYPDIARMSISHLRRRLPRKPSIEWYYENMTGIISHIKKTTPARIAVCSLPVIGENLSSPVNERVGEYSLLLQEMASSEKITYIPVFEAHREYLLAHCGTGGKSFQPGELLTLKLLLRHALLRQSYDEISLKNGFLLLTDGIHLNSQGAALIADKVEFFLRKAV